jgi:molybdopterin converting factor small subunit
MQVRVKVFATLSRYFPDVKPGAPFEVELPGQATLADLVRQLDLPEAEVRMIYVNARAQPLTCVLNSGDEVGIFPAVGGG